MVELSHFSEGEAAGTAYLGLSPGIHSALARGAHIFLYPKWFYWYHVHLGKP